MNCHSQPVIITFLLYNGSEEDGRAAFKPLLDIGMSQPFDLLLCFTHNVNIGPVVDMAKEVDYLAVNTMTVSSFQLSTVMICSVWLFRTCLKRRV